MIKVVMTTITDGLENMQKYGLEGKLQIKNIIGVAGLVLKPGGTTFISVEKSEAWLYGYKDPDKTEYKIDYWDTNGGTGGRRTYSRIPQSQTYAIKGICIGHFKNKILQSKWTRTAKVIVEAADPPYVSAIVFFNVTS